MTTALKLRRGTTTQHSTFTGADGEVTVDTTKKALVVHDGATAGGIPVARDSTVVHTTGNETIAGNKTFSSDASISGLTVGKGVGGGGNAAFGVGVLASNSGYFNTAIGNSALIGPTNSYNTGVGFEAGKAIINSGGLTAIGALALRSMTSGANATTAVGFNSLAASTTGSGEAFGAYALYSSTTGTSNVAVGYQSLYATTTASNNTAVGFQAGYSNTTGFDNTFMGWKAGYANTVGANSTAIGYQCFTNSNVANSANHNTGVGKQTGFSTTTGVYNSFFGIYAGFGNTTGSYNTYLGAQNSAGYGCAELMTTGSKNTIIGGFSGNQGGLDIRTASNYIVLSDGDGNPRAYWNQNGTATFNKDINVIGSAGGYVGAWYNSQDGGNNTYYHAFFRSGSQTGAIYHNGSSTLYTASSDTRLKENVVDSGSGLEKIAEIRIRSFDWKDSGSHTDFGVVAQELVQVAPECVLVGDDGPTIEKVWSVDTSALVPAMIKAIQELKAEVDSLKAQLNGNS